MKRTFWYLTVATLSLSGFMSFLPAEITFGHYSSASVAIAQTPLEAMTLERLAAILQAEDGTVEGESGQWQLTQENQTIIVLADEANNRMRIIAPIIPATTLSVEQVEAILVANYHSALDARYAVTNGIVVALYVHPLSSLQTADFRSGLRQVAALAANYGTTYSSGELGFGPTAEPAEDPKDLEGLIGI